MLALGTINIDLKICTWSCNSNKGTFLTISNKIIKKSIKNEKEVNK